MAKDSTAPTPRGPRKALVQAEEPGHVDCVIVAADRGSGRRRGWLSNYHLAVLDNDGYAEVGKTFKGLTDQSSAR